MCFDGVRWNKEVNDLTFNKAAAIQPARLMNKNFLRDTAQHFEQQLLHSYYTEQQFFRMSEWLLAKFLLNIKILI